MDCSLLGYDPVNSGKREPLFGDINLYIISTFRVKRKTDVAGSSKRSVSTGDYAVS